MSLYNKLGTQLNKDGVKISNEIQKLITPVIEEIYAKNKNVPCHELLNIIHSVVNLKAFSESVKKHNENLTKCKICNAFKIDLCDCN